MLTRPGPGNRRLQLGFTIQGQDITFNRPAALGPAAWDNHLDLLRTSYPDWIFDSGYLSA